MIPLNARGKIITRIAILTFIGLCLLRLPIGAQINLLHEFVGGVDDGLFPGNSLVLSGSTLYGMTSNGGDSDYGTIFKIQADGSGYTLLHDFAGSPDDGQNPSEDLIISGSTLYGMTNTGGFYNNGTIFKIETDGTGFTVLHSFSDSTADGKWPQGSLVLLGSTLFGMTYAGGAYDVGTIFKIETNGTGFSLLHSFGVGRNPNGSLIIAGSTLYGMTPYGFGNEGTLFKIESDGTGFTIMHQFTGGPDDGQWPSGSLTISGSTLYGMTRFGGANYEGTVFKINTDNTGYDLLHEFSGFTGDGMDPNGSLIISGSTLYGMNCNGGNNNFGTIFKIETDGSGYALLYKFAGGIDDGDSPNGSLILSGSTLYGMTQYGGDNDKGVIFSLPLPIPELTITSPNGGESWPRGSLQRITWDCAGVSGNARLVLFRNNVKTGVIDTVPVNQGCYDWAAGTYIGGMAVAAKNYKIKAVTVDGVYMDWSDADFTLSLDPYVQVVTPNGGESWAAGSQREIAWTSRGLSGNVRLVLYDGGAKVGTIDTVAASAGSFDWTVGNYIGGTAPEGTNFRIKIISTDGLIQDFSDSMFAITAD